MSLPGAGKADYLELGDWNAQCYQCGRKFKASMMRKHWQGYYVCPPHWEPRQPQDFVRAVPDNQTPPWTQPMPDATYTGPLVYTITGNVTSNAITFTPTFSATANTAYLTATSANPNNLINGPSNPAGPYLMTSTVTSGVPVTLRIVQSAGTRTWSI